MSSEPSRNAQAAYSGPQQAVATVPPSIPPSASRASPMVSSMTSTSVAGRPATASAAVAGRPATTVTGASGTSPSSGPITTSISYSAASSSYSAYRAPISAASSSYIHPRGRFPSFSPPPSLGSTTARSFAVTSSTTSSAPFVSPLYPPPASSPSYARASPPASRSSPAPSTSASASPVSSPRQTDMAVTKGAGTPAVTSSPTARVASSAISSPRSGTNSPSATSGRQVSSTAPAATSSLRHSATASPSPLPVTTSASSPVPSSSAPTQPSSLGLSSTSSLRQSQQQQQSSLQYSGTYQQRSQAAPQKQQLADGSKGGTTTLASSTWDEHISPIRFVPEGRDGCIHARAFKALSSDGTVPALQRVRKAHRFLNNRRHTQLLCMCCPPMYGYGNSLHLCLHCVFLACRKGANHMAAHMKETGHFLAMDVVHRQIYCDKCKDYIYDPSFERMAEIERFIELQRSLPLDRNRIPYVPWTPTDEDEAECLRSAGSEVINASYQSGLGLRGLYNLGNTCFTNCIIQTMVHNPLLRNFFLSGMHQRGPACLKLELGATTDLDVSDLAEYRSSSPTSTQWVQAKVLAKEPGGTYTILTSNGQRAEHVSRTSLQTSQDKAGRRKCLACVLNGIFDEMYSSDKSCFAAHELLYAVWQNSKHLAGYAQQDSHEFFIALLDGLHLHLKAAQDNNTGCIQHRQANGTGSLSGTVAGEEPMAKRPGAVPPSTASGENGICDCVVHRIFTGHLQSDVICTHCHAVSTTIDPFWDVSLGVKSEGTGKTLTIYDCLERFTRTEQLGSDALVTCSKCGVSQPAVKRLSLKRLPAVLCLHLKRFEHTSTARKIDDYVKFPETLDLQPFLAHSVDKRDGTDTGANGAASVTNGSGPSDAFQYTLFAVINHMGTLQSGHYTSFVRLGHQGGQWFRCEDEMVTLASSSQVLNSQAYMLFYVKSRLEYSAPSASEAGNGGQGDSQAC